MKDEETVRKGVLESGEDLLQRVDLIRVENDY